MSTRYIPQLNETNFVYPNYEISEYDVDIIHSINSNSISGTVTSLSATTISSSSITFRYSFFWSKNNADVFISSQTPSLFTTSVHMLAAGQNYYKPWRLIDAVGTSSFGATTQTITNRNVTVTAGQMGLGSFVTGTYYFEFRFIGLKSIFPVCQTLSITVP
jgi:hypothetical protein